MSRLGPIHSALLAMPLLLAADATTTALTPAASLTASAHATDFNGRIRNVRIRLRKSTSRYRIITRTTGDDTGATDCQEEDQSSSTSLLA